MHSKSTKRDSALSRAHRFFGIAVVAALTLVSVPGESAADDQKTIGGEICQPQDNSDTWQRFGWTGMTATDDDQTILCPLIVDDPGDVPEFTYLRIDKGAGEDASCSMYSVSALGGAVDATTETIASETPTSVAFDTSSLSYYTNGYFMVVCSVPSGTTIDGLRYGE